MGRRHQPDAPRRRGALDAHDTVALSLTDDTVICRAHAKSTPSLRELQLSLNSVDFGAMNSHTSFAQLSDLAIEPTGRIKTGGSPVTFRGAGFDGYYEPMNNTRCRWGAGADAADAAAPRLPTELVCASAADQPSGDVELSIALNAIDFANLSLAYRYYEPPSFASVEPRAARPTAAST